jgi:hypothetical protein
MLRAADVTACLVTRGDQSEMMQRIRESLIFDQVIVWNNRERGRDFKTAGRYAGASEATTRAVYFQDDDVIVPVATQEALLAAYESGVMVANWGHGENADGYDDLPLVGGGAIVDRELPLYALDKYLEHYPMDDGFLYEADFVAGVLYEKFRHVHLPFEIEMQVAQHESRLVNQPFQKELKLRITEQARAVRDGAMVTA